MSLKKSRPPLPSIEQIRADVARADAFLEQVKLTLGLVAGVSFGDIAPSRAGDEADDDATACVANLTGVVREQLAAAVTTMPWLVSLSDEERMRLQANAPGRAEREAMRAVVEVLHAMDPAELERMSQLASQESGVLMTRADVDMLRDNIERMDLLDRLEARMRELRDLAVLIQQGQLELARHEAEEARKARERN